jgi:hypothetical protein
VAAVVVIIPTLFVRCVDARRPAHLPGYDPEAVQRFFDRNGFDTIRVDTCGASPTVPTTDQRYGWD